jgi:hypothetical protein
LPVTERRSSGLPSFRRETFEDQRGGLIGSLVVEFNEAGIFKEPIDVSMIEAAEHDLRAFALVELSVNGHPLPAGPELDVVVLTYHRDDKVRLISIEFRQVHAEV